MNENKMNQPSEKMVEQLKREQAERRLDLILAAIEGATRRIDENPKYVSTEEIKGLETELLEVIDELGLENTPEGVKVVTVENPQEEVGVETVENSNENNSIQEEWFEKFEMILNGMTYLTKNDKKSLSEEYLSATEGKSKRIVKGVNGALGLKALKLDKEREAE